MKTRVNLTALVALTVVVSSCGGSKSSSSPTAPTPPNVAGNYNVQISASASCATSLPATARNRSYGTLTVTQAGTSVTMSIGTAVGTLPAMFGTLIGQRVEGQFEVIDTAGGMRYQVTGLASIPVSAGTLGTGSLNGGILTDTGNCVAADHRLIFARR